MLLIGNRAKTLSEKEWIVKTKIYILLGAIVLLLFMGFVAVKYAHLGGLVGKNQREGSPLPDFYPSSNLDRKSESTHEVDSLNTEITSAPVPESDEDWCHIEQKLSEQEKSSVYSESMEWAVKRGEILLPAENTSFEQQHRSLLAPYIEAKIAELVQHARNDDQFALLTLLQREDTPKELKHRSALHLMVLGNTSTALSYLVVKEMVLANFIYQEEGRINDEIKKHLVNSLAYVSYGLERLDVSALRAYLVIAKQHKSGTYKLDSESVLSDDGMSRVEDMKEQLVRYINNKRSEKHLNPIGYEDFPKVALREFESSLAVEYANFGTLINGSRNLKALDYDFEEKSTCLKALIPLYKNP